MITLSVLFLYLGYSPLHPDVLYKGDQNPSIRYIAFSETTLNYKLQTYSSCKILLHLYKLSIFHAH